MASMKFCFMVFLLVSILFISSDQIVGVEGLFGRRCRVPSRRFKGICVSDRNCYAICQSEGFTSGDCHGFRRRCICRSC